MDGEWPAFEAVAQLFPAGVGVVLFANDPGIAQAAPVCSKINFGKLGNVKGVNRVTKV